MKRDAARALFLILVLCFYDLHLAVGWAADPVSVVSLVHQSREKVAAQDLSEALSLARQAVRLDPAFADAWKQLGRVLMLRREYPEAISSLETALELKPQDLETPAWILSLLLELDRTQAAQLAASWEQASANTGVRLAATALRLMMSGNLAGAEKALKATPPPAEARSVLALAWTFLGNLYLQQQKAARAIDAYQEALRLQAGFVPALRELGWAFRRAGQPVQAAAAWERGLERNPLLTAWIVWIAEARSAAREPVTGSPAIQRLLASEPTQDQARVLKLALLLLEPDRGRAQAFEQQLAQQPQAARLTALAYAYADRLAGRYAEAARRLVDLERSYPNDSEIHRLLAETYTRWAEALPLSEKRGPLEKLVALKPGRLSAWRDLGWSRWAAKLPDAAIQAWSRAIGGKRGQGGALVEQVVALLVESGDAARAVELYRRWQPGGSLSAIGIRLVKSGRTLAADTFLEAAWKEQDQPARTGLYLARVKAQQGLCVDLPRYLAPFLSQEVGWASRDEIDILLKALKTCSDDPGILPLLRRVETQLAAEPGFDQPVSELLQQAASERQSQGYSEEALKLYRRSLARNPDRPREWFLAAELAQMLGEETEARAILTSTLVRARTPAVKEGIRGKLAQDAGQLEAAVALYRRSLAHDPQQPELRLSLFDSLVALKRFDEARQEGAWFNDRVAQGDYRSKIYLAQVRNALGQPAAALKLWREINLANPDNPYYAVETGRTLLNLCRAPEALEVVEPVVDRFPNVRAFELLAQINAALNRPREVLEWTEQGLELKQTRRLLELRVEAADDLGESDIVLEAGEALLALDRGYVPAARAVGRALQTLGHTEEARKYYEDLLKRNPAFLPSQAPLKDLASEQGKPREAVDYARETVAQRPWDADAARRLAVAQAEDQQFVPALATLRYMAGQSVNKILILVYSEVNSCAYPGRNSSRQVVSHLERLAASGYKFVVPPNLDNPSDAPQVMVVVVDTEAPALREIDAVLRRLGGQAVCAANPDVIKGQVPDPATAGLLQELQKSGRWLLASSGPSDRQPLPVAADGALGNPLTHRLQTPRGEETAAAMAQRLGQTLGDSAGSLPRSTHRTLIYPKGDYGQYSLDIDTQALNTLKGAVAGAFSAAVAGDDQGFIAPGYDPYRLPGRLVPPTWDENDLYKHLKEKNPYINARLDLAKVLSWNGQYEAANRWFRQADALGADPVEVNFRWGANAYFEGDLPTALAKLRRARELDPESQKVAAMLERAELARRPQLAGTFSGWRDSDGRSRLVYGGSGAAYVHDRLEVEAFSDRNIWARSGIGSEDGTRIGGGFKWHFLEECWLRGRLWLMNLDRGQNYAGWAASLHVPNPYLSGNLEFFTERDLEDTVEAVRKGILAYRQGVLTSTRAFDTWDVLANFYLINRTDGNNTPWGEFWLIKRLHEDPFYGLGALVQLATSNKDVPEYWSPQSLQEYLAYATTRGNFGPLHYSLSARVGPAKESSTDWRVVWGARAALELRITPKFSLSGLYDRLETPTYHRNLFWSGIFLRF
jgi:tetratricopeptide (TPR) repeat protein